MHQASDLLKLIWTNIQVWNSKATFQLHFVFKDKKTQLILKIFFVEKVIVTDFYWFLQALTDFYRFSQSCVGL